MEDEYVRWRARCQCVDAYGRDWIFAAVLHTNMEHPHPHPQEQVAADIIQQIKKAGGPWGWRVGALEITSETTRFPW